MYDVRCKMWELKTSATNNQHFGSHCTYWQTVTINLEIPQIIAANLNTIKQW